MKITIEFDPLELARGAVQTTTERQVGPSTPTTLPDMAAPDMALARTSGGAIDAGPEVSPPAPRFQQNLPPRLPPSARSPRARRQISTEGERAMDFIERLFGFSPDGGDGSFELLLFAIPWPS